MTFASGSNAWASSADDPAGGGVKRRGPPKVSDTTALITTLSWQPSCASGSVAARPSAGSARTTTSPRRAASLFACPMIGILRVISRNSAAFVLARSSSREPTMMECPARAQRVASPAPSLPVPPRMAMFMARLLAEQIARRIAQERLRSFLARGVRQAADDGNGNAAELAHHGLGGAGQLVGDGEDGGLQGPARGVGLTEIAEERRQPADTDGDVGETLAPGPSEGIGDHHSDVDAGGEAQALAELSRRTVRILGQQHHPAEVDVGLVDAGVGADPAVVRFGDEDAAVHAHHPPRLAQDDLDQPRISPEACRHGRGYRGGRHRLEVDDPALRLRDDLLADYQEITRRQGRALPCSRVRDQPGD